MICERCKEAGQKSRVFSMGNTSGLLGWQPYYDEEGKLHSHDPNTKTFGYKCSNGHVWHEKTKLACPNCDYGRGELQ